MERTTLIGFIKNLCVYFERKPVSQETLDQWFDDVGHLPAEPLHWISAKIKSLDSFPRNLPGTIRNYYSEWLDANPNKRAKDREFGCNNCNQGFVRVSRYEESLGNYYDILFKCSYCMPLYPESMQAATIPWLKDQGYCKPLLYLSSWKYADSLPNHAKQLPKSNDYPRKNIKTIVDEISNKFDLPF